MDCVFKAQNHDFYLSSISVAIFKELSNHMNRINQVFIAALAIIGQI
jgi:hypothetical protein